MIRPGMAPWTPKQEQLAVLLAGGSSIAAAAKQIKIGFIRRERAPA